MGKTFAVQAAAAQPATALARITADVSQASTVLADLVSQAITIAGTSIYARFQFSGEKDQGTVSFEMSIDGGAAVTGCSVGNLAAGNVSVGAGCQHLFTGLAPGAHTVKVQWKIDTGTARMQGASAPLVEQATLWLEEQLT